ncbi:DUF2752 domain-containing protein [Streptomyces sp. SID7982]|uniref:DUF2752 domain-containing protein n=1 Tax=Streptomyces rutgersensis TaxID=53451 RepID=A0ABX6RV10_9ACTN|nr:DUF2752 domain-containing protein [Streptomyces sp. BRB081]NEE28289.1 DUF2752 domain-containing protein [Streptomyces sp. SID7982]NEE59255.1 DUF2752 domain-containing protein [Streptomyces sp. SID8455]QNE84597.1 DUF2752 domain-containing protein [Streptomyces rutgersensis]
MFREIVDPSCPGCGGVRSAH